MAIPKKQRGGSITAEAMAESLIEEGGDGFFNGFW